jgi:hypothetical protein
VPMWLELTGLTLAGALFVVRLAVALSRRHK